MSLVQLPSNNNSQILFQPRWVLYRSAVYLNGHGITFGDAIVPHASKTQGRTSLNIDIALSAHCDIVDNEAKFIADASMDHVFIGPRLKQMDNAGNLIRQLTRKLNFNGHLVIAQKLSEFMPEQIKQLVSDAGHWGAKLELKRDGWFLGIYKKLYGKKGILPVKPRSGKPRACIARYGALGDMIILSPLISQLAKDGYEVTMNICPYCLPILDNNPYVSNIAIQERDMIPNPELGDYWAEWAKEYDKYINLSESLEGRFLKVEGRRDFYTPKAWRIKTGEYNYYDYTMLAGGYPDATGKRGELFFSKEEERNATKFFSQYKGKFVIIWALNGSSHHKVYPSMELVCEDWLLRHNDSIIVTVGDQIAKLLEFQHQRLIGKSGEWSIRESLMAAKMADLVIGPETMMTNAAGSLGTPTITFLSHSTHEALCKHFPADYCLAPDQELAPCYPCFQLHYTKESCPVKRLINTDTNEMIVEAPACAMDAISPAKVLARMEEVYSKQFCTQPVIMEADGA